MAPGLYRKVKKISLLICQNSKSYHTSGRRAVKLSYQENNNIPSKPCVAYCGKFIISICKIIKIVVDCPRLVLKIVKDKCHKVNISSGKVLAERNKYSKYKKKLHLLQSKRKSFRFTGSLSEDGPICYQLASKHESITPVDQTICRKVNFSVSLLLWQPNVCVDNKITYLLMSTYELSGEDSKTSSHM